MAMAHVALETIDILDVIMRHLQVEDLFQCCQVNRTWQSIALEHIRRRLISLSLCCPVTPIEHNCLMFFREKLICVQNIARLAKMKPTLIFLSHHVDLSDDPSLVNSIRSLLPSDSLITYFKLELIRNNNSLMYCSLIDNYHALRIDMATPSKVLDLDLVSTSKTEEPHEGVFGEIVFGTTEKLRTLDNSPHPPIGLQGQGGAIFENICPGVLQFYALQIADTALRGQPVTTYFSDASSGRYIQVISGTVFNTTLSSNRLDVFMRNLRQTVGSIENCIAVAFPKNEEDCAQELRAFEQTFPDVPALANPATEFNLDGHYMPLGRIKLVMLIIKLL